MAIAITRANIKANFNTGDTPTEAQFASMIDAFPMVYVETVSLVLDTDLSISHNNAERARIVQVTDSAGVAIDVSWRLDSSDPTNTVIINSGKAYANAVVSILTK